MTSKKSSMDSNLNHSEQLLQPEMRRVIAKYYGPEASQVLRDVIMAVVALSENELKAELDRLKQNYGHRHRNYEAILIKNYQQLPENEHAPSNITHQQKLLIGAYFTSEYSIEAAALFNPSMVPHPNQNDLPSGSIRFIMSLRAVGEGHISSIVFRSGVIDHKNVIKFDPCLPFSDQPMVSKIEQYQKDIFIERAITSGIDKNIIDLVFTPLAQNFSYQQLSQRLETVKQHNLDTNCRQQMVNKIKYIANAEYTLAFSQKSSLSERVIYPGITSPIYKDISNGMEDARFVQFTDQDGKRCYYATYTAYNGQHTLPKLLLTKDFVTFRTVLLNGKSIRGKGMALFPRLIGGKYVMLSRQGRNNKIMYSNNLSNWNESIAIEAPSQLWNMIKVGNCGSPIETDSGWLVITHGVGMMREYCISAILLDLEQPHKVIAYLKQPLFKPNNDQREGYVPNVLYSCGPMRKDDELVIPYGISDHRTGIVTVKLAEVLEKLEPVVLEAWT